MLNLTWIKNPDHVSYCKENEVLPRLARELGIADLAQQVEERLKDCKANLTVAVMGCAVNGPGEAREADIGIAGGDGCAILFQKGEIIRKIPEDQVVEELVREVEKLALHKEG